MQFAIGTGTRGVPVEMALFFGAAVKCLRLGEGAQCEMQRAPVKGARKTRCCVTSRKECEMYMYVTMGLFPGSGRGVRARFYRRSFEGASPECVPQGDGRPANAAAVAARPRDLWCTGHSCRPIDAAGTATHGAENCHRSGRQRAASRRGLGMPAWSPSAQEREMTTALQRTELQTNWATQLARTASSTFGLGQTIAAISSIARKRDLSALWELDPVAAPPTHVQKELLGEAEQDESEQASPCIPERNDTVEMRSILELQLKFAMRRHDVDRVRAISRQLRCLEDVAQATAATQARARGELRIGDECYALAKVVEWEWYRARLLNVRRRAPQLQIEYLATLDGDDSRLALPVPRLNHVPPEHVCLIKPEPSEDPVIAPTIPGVFVAGMER